MLFYCICILCHQISIEIAGLEQDLESRHVVELAQFQSLNCDKTVDGGDRDRPGTNGAEGGEVGELGEGVAQMTVENGEGEEEGPRKKSRAQKRKVNIAI